jgi:hypothetical protein
MRSASLALMTRACQDVEKVGGVFPPRPSAGGDVISMAD